jgi:hypothetical protein
VCTYIKPIPPLPTTTGKFSFNLVDIYHFNNRSLFREWNSKGKNRLPIFKQRKGSKGKSKTTAFSFNIEKK